MASLHHNKLLFSFLFLILLTSNILRAQVPVASFTTDKNTGCAPLLVNFTNTSTSAVSFTWNFGNSNTSTISNPSTAYITPGIFTVTLIVTSAGGQRDTATTIITVVNDPIAAFVANPLSGCEDYNIISFTNNSINANSYTWDFGDGNTSILTNPTHTYLNPGTYSIKLIAINAYGCQNIKIRNAYVIINPKPSAQFTANITSSCNVSTTFNFTSQGTGLTNWQWDFDDGTSSTTSSPSHQYSSAGIYAVTLIASNANGCRDTLVKPNYINIGSSLVPSFTSSDTAGCAPLIINFNATVANATSWNWTFGDGTSSTIANPSHTYSAPGNYSLTLTVTTLSGCNGSITIPQYIKIDSLPIVNFTVQQDTGCVPFLANFINTTTGATSYSWDFGNGGTSPLQNPTPMYNQGGNFNVTLTGYSLHGCSSVKKINNLIKAWLVRATFIANPLSGCPGTVVQFTTNGTVIGITNWLWNFGDGTISSLQNPSHTYNSVGSYTAWLIITNSFGCKDTVYKSHYINITSGIVPYTVPDTIPVCQGAPIGFSDPTLGSNNWLWNFGDGTTSTNQNPSYTYFIPGLYTVTLNTSMPGGCSQSFNPFAIVNVIPYDPKPIDLNFIGTCKPYTISFSTTTPDITSYSWDFGDGGTSTLSNPTHIFQTAGTYGITLNVTIGAGCQTIITTTVTVGHVNPMSVNSSNICLSDISQFTFFNTAAFTSWQWAFGDGSTSTLASPTHIYAVKGSYTPLLTTLDTLGCRDTFALAAILVNNPIPSFTVNQTPCINASVQFQNTSTNATSYLWDFGDGTTSNDPNPVHTYTVSGNFTILLSATSDSCTRTSTFSNFITVIDPVCSFIVSTSGQCIPISAQFTDGSPTAINWLWNFGDGTNSSQHNPTHIYTLAPTDSIKLTITDVHGCIKSYSQKAINYYSAVATIDNTTGCVPHTSQFTDLSNSATSWLWNFGDNTTSTLQNPPHNYITAGIFTVTLIAHFPGGCIDTAVYSNMITIEKPTANFYSPTIGGCSPTQISFTNQSFNATTYLWNFGDAGTSTTDNPSHIYYIPGYYDVMLIATSSNGCSDTIKKINYIHIPGTNSHFNISSTSGCESLAVTFTDSSINASSWFWNFGDGFIDSIQNPIHLYQDTGAYTVTLITQDTTGCTSSYTFPLPVNIYPNPIAHASVTDTIGCSSYLTIWHNESQYANSYLWLFGDNDSSNAIDPTHTYLSGGIYQPTIIAMTQYGCRDTFQIPVNIHVLQTPVSSFNVSDTIACNPSNITFTSTATLTQNPSFSWTFGNSQTANGSTVATNYSIAGTYQTQLIVTNNNGCMDSTTINLQINPSPVAAATTDISEGCQNLQVNFSNNSSGAISYTWHFGNGDSSILFSPTYIYLQAGIFNASVIAENGFGCKNTFNINPVITVHATPYASFIADNYTGCAPSQIQFTNQSTNLVQPNYSWNFNDGTLSNATNPSHLFINDSLYVVQLEVVNAFGCKSDTSINVTINPTPIANANIDATVGCSPLAITFNNLSLGATNYFWNFGDNDTSTSIYPVHSYQWGGLFNPYLIASNNFGCSDTFYLPMITINQSPVADFIADSQKGCVGSPIQFTNLTPTIYNPIFNWDFGFTTSTIQNPLIVYNTPGFYNVTLTITNSNGCSSTYTETAYIEIYDTLPPPPDSILSVTVLTDTEVQITWANSNATDLKAYMLYRYNSATTNYQLIYTDHNPATASIKPTSSFTETNLNTLTNTYTYKLQTIDLCNNVLPLQQLQEHTTINITAQQAGQNIRVRWSAYGGCTVTNYELWRAEVSNGIFQQIALVAGNKFTYLDTTLVCPFNYSYRVIATDLCGSIYTSNSDTSVARPINILEDQKVEIIRSTVINNLQVLTEWLPPLLHPERVLSYSILRSTDKVNFNKVGSVPVGITTFTDNQVDVQKRDYYYRIDVINDCELAGKISNEGSSILLIGKQTDLKTDLIWTPYKEWQPGVENYSIERQRPDGTWELVKVVDGNITTMQIDE